jgi:integrase
VFNMAKNDITGLKLSGQAWVYSYRIAGRARRMTLGHAPGLVPADARRAAQHFAGLVAIGRCPSSERKAARIAHRTAAKAERTTGHEPDQIERVAKLYLKHAKERTRASTFTGTARVFAKAILPEFRGRRLSTITRADIRKMLDKVIDRGSPVAANRILSACGTFFAFAVEQDLISANPCTAIRPPAPETPRERCLTDDELGAVWRASLTLGEYGAICRLLILTGQRRSEVAEMRLSELDLPGRLWNIPAARCKNGRAHSVPLSDAAIAILESLKSANLAVFAPVSFSREKGLLDKLLPPDMPSFTIHDLRRTFASGCASLGVAPHVIEKCLNHQSGIIRGVAATYNKFQYGPEKKAALDLWSCHIAALASGHVVPSKAACA